MDGKKRTLGSIHIIMNRQLFSIIMEERLRVLIISTYIHVSSVKIYDHNLNNL